jgi:2-polyprenyl-6-hydroxyphenyl methylase/3-demethylubiquinone-9 3-methyltransferase
MTADDPLASTTSTVDPAEVEKFETFAAEWWSPHGKFRPLHRFNPVRLGYIRDVAVSHFGRDARIGRALAGLRVLDIGCGGGLLSEPMARLGANVVGIDPSTTNVEIARLHAAESSLEIDYRATTAEDLAATGEKFDIVLAMEVVEHVPNVTGFLAAAAALTSPGGILFVATINRTARAFALAIVGAEYVLRWLPRGTHEYERLVRPAELEAGLAEAGLSVLERTGLRYNPLTDSWSRTGDLAVNYMMVAEKREAKRAA